MSELEPYITIQTLLKDKTFPIGRNSMYKLVQTGKIRARQNGNRWILLKTEVWEDIKLLNKGGSNGTASRQRK